MIEVHLLFMQDEHVLMMGELPRAGEWVTLAPMNETAQDYVVSMIHWFKHPERRELIPYVSLRLP